MTNNQLIVNAEIDEFGNEDISVKLGDNTVFWASRYGQRGYSSVFWMVDHSKTKNDYFQRMVAFYQELRTGNFEDRGERGLDLGILLKDFKEGNTPEFVKDYNLGTLPLNMLDGKNPPLLQHRLFNDFTVLRVDSPYAAFTMEDFSGTPWKPTTGFLAVITHQDLSEIVAGYIADTARHPAPKELLQPILKEKAYTFKR